MTGPGWLKGERQTHRLQGQEAPGEEGSEEGRAQERSGGGRREREGTWRRMDRVLERRAFRLTIVANQATLNFGGIKQPSYYGRELYASGIWAGQRGCLSSVISGPQREDLKAGAGIIWSLLHSLVPELE